MCRDGGMGIGIGGAVLPRRSSYGPRGVRVVAASDDTDTDVCPREVPDAVDAADDTDTGRARDCRSLNHANSADRLL